MTQPDAPHGSSPAASRTLCSIRGMGRHLPERQLTNADLEKIMDTTDEWIVQRTGISARRVLPDDWITSDLAVAAAEAALADAGMDRSEIDLLIVATVTPDHLCPSTACVVQKKLGMPGVPALDISVACSGFGYALSLAAGMIASGLHRNVLVIGAEAMTRFMNYEDRTSSILFGDGAGAVVVSPEGRFDVLYTDNGADGSLAEMIEIPGGGAREPASESTLRDRRHFVTLRGREVFKTAVRQMSQSTRQAVEALGLQTSDIDWLIPHQANARIIEAVGENLGLAPEKVVIDIGDKGNTTAASIPIAMTGIYEAGGFEPGQLVILVGFGAGAAWSCQAIRVRG
ncbi:MAG: beta-ketoacyl-ACP synthase III [Planctomycetota bacterium]